MISNSHHRFSKHELYFSLFFFFLIFISLLSLFFVALFYAHHHILKNTEPKYHANNPQSREPHPTLKKKKKSRCNNISKRPDAHSHIPTPAGIITLESKKSPPHPFLFRNTPRQVYNPFAHSRAPHNTALDPRSVAVAAERR